MEHQQQSTVGFILLILAAGSLYVTSSDTGTAFPYSMVRWIGGAVGASLVLVGLLVVSKRLSAFSIVLVFGVASVLSAGSNIAEMLARKSQTETVLEATEAVLSGTAIESSQPLSKAVAEFNTRIESAYSDYGLLLTEAGFENALKPHVISNVAEATSRRKSLTEVLNSIPGLSARAEAAWEIFETDLRKIGTETAKEYLSGAMSVRAKSISHFTEYYRIQSDLLGAIVAVQTLAIEVGGISKEDGQYILPDDDSVVRFNTLVNKIQIHAAEEEEWMQRGEQMVGEAQKQISGLRR